MAILGKGVYTSSTEYFPCSHTYAANSGGGRIRNVHSIFSFEDEIKRGKGFHGKNAHLNIFSCHLSTDKLIFHLRHK